MKDYLKKLIARKKEEVKKLMKTKKFTSFKSLHGRYTLSDVSAKHFMSPTTLSVAQIK